MRGKVEWIKLEEKGTNKMTNRTSGQTSWFSAIHMVVWIPVSTPIQNLP